MIAAATLIPHTEGRIVPWANGLGTSREIILEPAGPRRDSPQWLWRLATTRIEADCPFSLCAGQDRIIVLLKGNGFELTHASARPQAIAAPFGATHFGGDWHTSCRLIDGPVEVLNVMAFRDRITCSIAQVSVGKETLAQLVTAATKAIYVLDGDVMARLAGEPELSLQTGGTVRLEIKAPRVMQLRARNGFAHLLLLETQGKPLPA
jgi:environmental stress-induced protein Ves